LIGRTLAVTSKFRKRETTVKIDIFPAGTWVRLGRLRLSWPPVRRRSCRRQGHGPYFRQQRKVQQHYRARSQDPEGVKDLKTSRRPRDMHFSADRTKLYVACGDDDVIEIIDVAKLEVIGRIPTGASPETFVVDEKRGASTSPTKKVPRFP
jgi:YVTN family beta-propeller protein